ncbi:hypothetical protein [Robbsia sp. KACC 23696]|uniref:hypothetical protein n=1 Tax=Robbsia sp. KACC 23696 TaxID=3149231 RepID=UPI00325A9BAB
MLFWLVDVCHADDGVAPNTTTTTPARSEGASQASSEGAPPVTWNDTYLGFRYGTDFHYPGVPDKVAQRIGTLATTGGFRFGSYSFNVDYLVSNAANPEAGTSHESATGGAQEVYSVGRVEWSASKVLGRPMQFGFIRDIGFTTGYEFGTKNDAYAEAARMLVFGPTIEFAVPRGFWNVTAGVRTEHNHNGLTNTDVSFHAAWHLESAWMVPFRLGPVPLVFKGFASVTGPKGKDGFNVNTTTEFLTRVSVLADLGSFAGHPRVLYAGVGYEYWHNMYGTPSSETVNTNTSAPMVMAEIHF